MGDLKRTEDGIQKLPGSISTEYKLGLATAAVVALAKDSVERKGYDVARFLVLGPGFTAFCWLPSDLLPLSTSFTERLRSMSAKKEEDLASAKNPHVHDGKPVMV